jgi:hypothetical protein
VRARYPGSAVRWYRILYVPEGFIGTHERSGQCSISPCDPRSMNASSAESCSLAPPRNSIPTPQSRSLDDPLRIAYCVHATRPIASTWPPSGSDSSTEHAAAGVEQLVGVHEHAAARQIGAALLRGAEVAAAGERIEVGLDRRDADGDVRPHALEPAAMCGGLRHECPSPSFFHSIGRNRSAT